MQWNVSLKGQAEKQALKLPSKVLDALMALMVDIRNQGPVRGNWLNYSKLTGNRHHCHLKRGRPSYVAVWTEDKKTITVEIIYAGTHEKAPY